MEEYIGVFEPLLFEEVKALILQGRDEEGAFSLDLGFRNLRYRVCFLFFFFFFSIPWISWVTDETDWQKGAVASCAETDGFHNISLAVLDEFRERVSENDLLLLSKEKVEFSLFFVQIDMKVMCFFLSHLQSNSSFVFQVKKKEQRSNQMEIVSKCGICR